NGGEFIVKSFSLDFYDKLTKKCIEFYGDRFHANPLIYKNTDTPNPFEPTKTSQIIWEYDKNRLNVLKSNNIKTLIVWEMDYKMNKQQTIEKCISFLNNEFTR
ncbi:MAG: hypothetical protein WCP38_03230, partial [Chloroflexota bacterium]